MGRTSGRLRSLDWVTAEFSVVDNSRNGQEVFVDCAGVESGSLMVDIDFVIGAVTACFHFVDGAVGLSVIISSIVVTAGDINGSWCIDMMASHHVHRLPARMGAKSAHSDDRAGVTPSEQDAAV